VLRRTGTLARHLTRHRTAATAMLDDLAPLVELAEGDAAVRAAVEEATVPQDPRFRAAWRDWLDRHGHRGVFESDIARPRFAEDPAPILRAVAARAATRTSRPGRDLATALTTPVWLAVRRPMAARERLRSRAMRGFAAIRARLLALAAEAADEGRLPAASDVWLLTADEVITLDHGAVFDDDAVARRRSERRRLAALRLPDTVHRFDDLDAGRRDGHAPMAVIGASLVPGVVQGRALRATEPPATLPDGFHGDDTVLVARSVDAGWVPIFRQVAGVAVEIGGDLSHGSIILRELGVPSVTNLGQLGAAPATGDRVELDADRGRLRLLEA
jgi:phosphohistidine swiveling domain-containing protein